MAELLLVKGTIRDEITQGGDYNAIKNNKWDTESIGNCESAFQMASVSVHFSFIFFTQVMFALGLMEKRTYISNNCCSFSNALDNRGD